MMYSDPVKGLRTIPDYNDIEKNKIVVPETAVFHIDLTSKLVTLQANGKKVDFGSELTYIVTTLCS